MLKTMKCLVVAGPCLAALLLAGCGDPAPPAAGEGPTDKIMQSNGPNPTSPQLGIKSGSAPMPTGSSSSSDEKPAGEKSEGEKKPAAEPGK